MSNPNQFFQDLSFDPEEITAVNKAYDLACQTLQNIGQPEVDREIIAARLFFRPPRAANGTPANFASAPSMD
jgi:hypothetical protein